MNEKRVYSNVQERIALDNYKIERVRHKKIKKRLIIAASAATAFVAGVIAVKAISNRD